MCRVFVSPDVAFAGEVAIAQVTHPTIFLFPHPPLLRLPRPKADGSWRRVFMLGLRNHLCREIYNALASQSRLGVHLSSLAASGRTNERQLNIALNLGWYRYLYRILANRLAARP
jgi:hypothetical protein